MQQIGTLSDAGFQLEDLLHIKAAFERECGGDGCGATAAEVQCHLVPLHDLLPAEAASVGTSDNAAYVLIVKNAVNLLLGDVNGSNALFDEQDELEKDTKAFMYGRVVNKHARHNLCFSDAHQEPDYAAGKGRVYAFEEVPCLHRVRQRLGELLRGMLRIVDLDVSR